jgi:hypothetical protein
VKMTGRSQVGDECDNCESQMDSELAQYANGRQSRLQLFALKTLGVGTSDTGFIKISLLLFTNNLISIQLSE